MGSISSYIPRQEMPQNTGTIRFFLFRFVSILCFITSCGYIPDVLYCSMQLGLSNTLNETSANHLIILFFFFFL
ncbi:hypothetical protein XENTR_v10013306 [Xenopus tropicalis]|nr:hypothetical protein XENTR_v10013306 [Xenopus tropicalis]